jgi:hypothetical protein
MDKTKKLLSIFILLTMLLLTSATPAYAFEGREGNKVVIAADEVINDDLKVI